MKKITAMSINGKSVKMCKLGGGILMDKSREYQALEWIASDAKQYIDTGYCPTRYTVANFDVQFVEPHILPAGGSTAIMGAQTLAQNGEAELAFYCNFMNGFGTVNVWLNRGYTNGATQWQNSIGDRATERNIIRMGNSKFLYGDLICTSFNPTVAWETIDSPICILGCSRLGLESRIYAASSAFIYGFWITEHGQTLLDLRPALRLSDGAVGMYDTVSGDFKVSLGERPFIAGSEIEGQGW